MNLVDAVKKFSAAETPSSDTDPNENVGSGPQGEEQESVDTEHEAAAETHTDPEETPSGDTESETYELSYGDEKLNLTIDELKKGYLRERDYQFKRGEDAKKAREVSEKLEKLNDVIGVMESELQEEVSWFESQDAKDLEEDDPDAYLKRFKAAQKRLAKYQDAKKLRDEQQAKSRELKQSREREKLLDLVPEWKDKGIYEKEVQSIVKVMKDAGFTDEQIQDTDDHRYFLMARKLAKLEEIQRQDPSKKKVTKVLKSAEPGVPDTTETAQQKARKEQRAKLKKTGKLSDAVKLFSM